MYNFICSRGWFIFFIAHNVVPMSLESATITGPIEFQIAEDIDADALEVVTQREGTIASIAKEQNRLMAEKMELQDVDASLVGSKLQSLQGERMGAIDRNPNATITKDLRRGSIGRYEGDLIYLDADNITQESYEAAVKKMKKGLEKSEGNQEIPEGIVTAEDVTDAQLEKGEELDPEVAGIIEDTRDQYENGPEEKEEDQEEEVLTRAA